MSIIYKNTLISKLAHQLLIKKQIKSCRHIYIRQIVFRLCIPYFFFNNFHSHTCGIQIVVDFIVLTFHKLFKLFYKLHSYRTWQYSLYRGLCIFILISYNAVIIRHYSLSLYGLYKLLFKYLNIYILTL